MIEGCILGFMTFISLLLTFFKLPIYIRNFIRKHKFAADVGTSILVYFTLGAISKSIIAIVGTIVATLLVGITLEATAPKNLEQID